MFSATIQAQLSELPPLFSGTQLALPFSIHNSGSEAWTQDAAQPVRLAYVWMNAQRQPVAEQSLISPLAEDVAAGASTQALLHLQVPAKPGRYLLSINLLQEGVDWFAPEACAGLLLEATVLELHSYCSGAIKPLEKLPASLPPDTRFATFVQLSSAAAQAWPAFGEYPLVLAYQWRNVQGEVFSPGPNAFTRLAADVYPKQSLRWPISVRTPALPGDYQLIISLCLQNTVWFHASPSFKASALALRVSAEAEPKALAFCQASQAKAEQFIYQAWVEQQAQQQSQYYRQQPVCEQSLSLFIIADDSLDTRQLKTSLGSLSEQVHTQWQAYLLCSEAQAQKQQKLLQKWQKKQPNLQLVCGEDGLALLNQALAQSSDSHALVLQAGDSLAPQALAAIAQRLQAQPALDFVYFDEDVIDLKGQRSAAFFQPSEPETELLFAYPRMAQRYAFRCVRARELGGYRSALENAHFDLKIRLLAAQPAAQRAHIAQVLYSQSLTSFSETLSPAAQQAGLESLQAQFPELEISAQDAVGYRLRYPLPEPPPKVSIIIPTRNALALLRTCIGSLTRLTDYPNYELLIINNQSDEPETLAYLQDLRDSGAARVLDYDQPFNYSAMMNLGAAQAQGELLCQLNNDTEILHADWLQEMVSQALRPEIGVVGACLWYGNDTLQHGGVVFLSAKNIQHRDTGLARAQWQSQPQHVRRFAYNPSAVTGACLVLRTALYQQLGGMDAEELAIGWSDHDLCLKAGQLGLRNLWTPYAQLYHHESVTRSQQVMPKSQEIQEFNSFTGRWSAQLAQDPAYHPAFSAFTQGVLQFSKS